MLLIPNFADGLCDAIRSKGSVLCVGLDPQLCYMPPHLIRERVGCCGRTFEAVGMIFTEFNCQIIDALHDLAPCAKIQLAHYEKYGSHGIRAYQHTVEYARNAGLLVIADGKRGDGGDSAAAYADGYLGEVPFFGKGTDPTDLCTCVSPMRVDCLTVNASIAEACVSQFLPRIIQYGTGMFVVDKTSFTPNSAIEQLVTQPDGQPVWQQLAKMVGKWSEGTEGSCGLYNVGVVAGATFPEDAVKMREILPKSIFLVPGYGGQGATADDAVRGIRSDGLGVIVNDSRRLIYAWQKGEFKCPSEDFAKAARLQGIKACHELAEACLRARKNSQV